MSVNQSVLVRRRVALLAEAACPPLGDAVNLGDSWHWHLHGHRCREEPGAGLAQQVEAPVISAVFYCPWDVVFHHSAEALNESPGAAVRRDGAARL